MTKSRLRSAVLVGSVVACFFVSGLTSLALETAWSKYLSYLLGTDLYGAATTVVAYMGGLGLGALLAAKLYHRVRSPLKIYAALQAGIGVFGMLSIPLLRATHPLFELLFSLNDNQQLFLLFRFAVTFGLLLPSTILMGMTLPVVIGSYGSLRTLSATSAGLLYGMNTLGAVAGTLLSGLAAIPHFGLTATCVGAGAVDLLIAGVALLLHRGLSRSLPASAPPTESAPPAASTAPEESADVAVTAAASEAAKPIAPSPDAGRRFLGVQLPPGFSLGASYLLCGAVALGLELCWFRLMGHVIGPSSQAFCITLAVFLAGIGLGSLLASRWATRFADAEFPLLLLLLVVSAAAVTPLYYLARLPAWYQALWTLGKEPGSEALLIVTQAVEACVLMLPATLAMGAMFPLVVQSLLLRAPGKASLSAVSAGLFFANTIGAALGTLLWGFGLVPVLGVHSAMRVAAGVSLLAALIIVLTRKRAFVRSTSSTLRAAIFASAGLGVVALIVQAPKVDTRAMNLGTYKNVRQDRRNIQAEYSPKTEVIFARDGLNATIAVVKNRFGAGELDLTYAGKWEASTISGSRPHLHLLAHAPMLLAKKTAESALVIGFGSGVTTGSLLRYPSLKSVDVVEIEPAVIEASKFFEEYNHAPLSDPRAHLILQDGRTYVAFSRKKYDLITSDPVHPWVKGAANLYTQEYYRRAAGALNEGGIFAQWIPTTMTTNSFKTILRTMQTAFPNVSVFVSGVEMIAFGAKEPLQPDWSVIEARTQDPVVENDLVKNRLGTPRKFYEHIQQDLRPVRMNVGGPVNTDDNVYLEHRLPWDVFYGSNVRLSPRKPR